VTNATSDIPAPLTNRRIAVRCLSVAALLLAMAVGACLGFRTISSFDIGYHLAYGETFLDTGRVVDSSPELYTLDDEALARARELPPGAWIDEHGVYRFPNANWASQVLFALVHRSAGMIGLGVLQAGLVAGVFLAVTISMRRLGLGVTWTAFGVLLIALTAYERFMLRPELAGYFVLAVQFALLLPVWRNEASLHWWRVAALAALQLLLVNLHSYWLLGLGMTLAGFAGAGLGLVLPSRKASPETSLIVRIYRSGLFRLTVLLGLQAGASFVNPWTWRLAALPFQTLAFFSKHQISTAEARLGGHPWAVIGEFFRPWESPFADIVATKGFFLMLAFVLAALVYTALRRRWAVGFLLVGMTAMSLAMRRNIAPGAILLTPAALACVSELLGGWSVWRKFAAQPAAPFATAVVLGCIAGGLISEITSNRFYFDQRRADRFGLGVSLANTPVQAARWLSEHQPEGRLWTDYDSSSNFYYFTRFTDWKNPSKTVHPNVPILTNTWAYPPDIMQESLDVSRGVEPLRNVVKQYGLEIVALRVTAATTPLAVELSEDRGWGLVYLDAMHTVWIRTDGVNAFMARSCAIRRETFDLADFRSRLRDMDPEAPFTFHIAGVTLQRLGWFSEAIDVLQTAVMESPRYSEAWFELGACFALRSQETRNRRRPAANLNSVTADLREAQYCFGQCLSLHPPREYRDKAQAFLTAVQQDYQLLTTQKR
jgi:hypothetical protein